MKMEGQDAKDIQSLLQDSMDVGLKYMVYNRESPAFKPHEGYPFFGNKEEAQWSADFFSQRSGQENVVLPILAIEQRLSRELELQAIRDPLQVVPKDIVMDEGFMVKQETARERIFTEQLKQQLEQQGIKAVDNNELAVHIEQDKQQFNLTAVRFANGKEELLTVRIQQNADRAFQIVSIQPDMQQPIKEPGNMERAARQQGTNGMSYQSDPDANPLYSKEEDPFVAALLDHWESAGVPSPKNSLIVDRAALVEDLDQRMKSADWHYDYSDDPSVWQKGLVEVREIQQDLHALSLQPNGLAEARQLWELHVPSASVSLPDFLKEDIQQQKETVRMEREEVLGGTIQPDKALELKQYLQSEKEAGNRFVAFESNQSDLTKDHFQGFRSAFSAMEFAYEQTTDRDRFIVRSIAVVEKEVENVLVGPQRGLEQQPEKEQENKRSHDQELSR